MCKWGTTVEVAVTIDAAHSYTGEERQAVKKIDACIAPIVDALNRGGPTDSEEGGVLSLRPPELPVAQPDRICPDCDHPRSLHMNTVACCAVVGKHPDSDGFEGGLDYCFCERLEGFR